MYASLSAKSIRSSLTRVSVAIGTPWSRTSRTVTSAILVLIQAIGWTRQLAFAAATQAMGKTVTQTAKLRKPVTNSVQALRVVTRDLYCLPDTADRIKVLAWNPVKLQLAHLTREPGPARQLTGGFL